MLCSIAWAAIAQTKSIIKDCAASLQLCVLYTALPDICHSPARCGFTHTAKTLCADPHGESNIVYITCSTVRGCQGTAHPGSCSPIICSMMASHTPHLQCSQPPLKFNNSHLKEHAKFGKSDLWSGKILPSGKKSQSIMSKFYFLTLTITYEFKHRFVIVG